MRRRTRANHTPLLTLTAALCLSPLLSSLSACSGGADESAAVLSDALSVTVSADGVTERISLWMPDETHAFAFLPSCAGPESAVFELHTTERVLLDGKRLRSGDTGSGFAVNEPLELNAGRFGAVSFRFVQSSGTASMFIDTESGGMEAVHADKKTKEECRITLFDQNGKINYASGDGDQIRGRGHWTWEQEKKPYNLYLDEAADLLGLGASRHWTLLANAMDETNLRNWMVFHLADEVAPYGGFSQGCEFTDLYLNGQYAGLYLLCEKVEFGETRLDAPDGTVLFSLDAAYRMDDMDTAFLMNPGIAVEIDEPSDAGAEEAERLKAQLLEMQEAFLAEEGPPDGGKIWSDYIDPDSWARKYLIEEIFLNYDAGAQSQYFFEDPEDGRIYAGPCWDYDNILGVYGDGLTPECFLAQRIWKTAEQYTPWYGSLWKKGTFSEYARTLYETEFLPALTRLEADVIPQEAERIRPAAEADRLRWPDLFKTYATFDEAVDGTLAFLDRRIRFLNSAWIDGTEYCTVALTGPYIEYRYFCVEPGTVCRDLTTPEDLGLAGAVWRYADTGELFAEDTVIREDVVLEAVWDNAAG